VSISGVADLPLHDGSVPPWLFSRMVKLSRLIVMLMVEEFGLRDTIRRFSNPVFFQAFNNLIGMDWDSSGSTTITTAVLREALDSADIGIRVLGGKGKRAQQVPREIDELPDRFNVDRERLKTVSRLVAKVDSVALQDGYQIYHHAVIVGEDGTWTIVQQGMKPEQKLARRYHWWCETTFTIDPHSGISGLREKHALNLVSSRSMSAQRTILDIVREGPAKIMRDMQLLRSLAKRLASRSKTILEYVTNREECTYYNPYLQPEKVQVLLKLRPNERALTMAREASDFKELLLTPKLGPNTMLALALIAELIYSSPVDWEDPVTHDPRRYAFALGGKDGSPYPVDPKVYDDVLRVLESVVEYVRKNNDRGMLKYLRHLAKTARKINLPLDKVFPTPP